MALRIAFVGATGAVGAEFLKILGSWGTRISDLRLLASARSAGSKLSVRGEMIEVMETTPASFDGVDIAFLSASTAASKVWGPAAVEAGAVVIDDSSAFRLDPAVPLVVPEVNAAEIERLIRDALPDARITIEDLRGDGDHYAAHVASTAFKDKSRVQQHQMVYQALRGKMGDALHALALQTKAPDDAASA